MQEVGLVKFIGILVKYFYCKMSPLHSSPQTTTCCMQFWITGFSAFFQCLYGKIQKIGPYYHFLETLCVTDKRLYRLPSFFIYLVNIHLVLWQTFARHPVVCSQSRTTCPTLLKKDISPSSGRYLLRMHTFCVYILPFAYILTFTFNFPFFFEHFSLSFTSSSFFHIFLFFCCSPYLYFPTNENDNSNKHSFFENKKAYRT